MPVQNNIIFFSFASKYWVVVGRIETKKFEKRNDTKKNEICSRVSFLSLAVEFSKENMNFGLLPVRNKHLSSFRQNQHLHFSIIMQPKSNLIHILSNKYVINIWSSLESSLSTDKVFTIMKHFFESTECWVKRASAFEPVLN